MYIKMNSNKSLIVTVPTTIYRGEKNADLITFLIPSEYGNVNLADCAATLRYVMPSGVGRSESLNYLPEMYKSYLQFSTPVNTRFAEERGNITMWLTFFNDDIVVLKTGEIEVSVSQSKDIIAYLPPDGLDQIDQLSKRMDAMENEKADSMVYDSDENTLQLTANGNRIGALIDMDAVVDDTVGGAIDEAIDEANKVIHFGESTDEPGGSDDDSSELSGGVIYF